MNTMNKNAVHVQYNIDNILFDIKSMCVHVYAMWVHHHFPMFGMAVTSSLYQCMHVCA